MVEVPIGVGWTSLELIFEERHSAGSICVALISAPVTSMVLTCVWRVLTCSRASLKALTTARLEPLVLAPS
jgi:hypothetical protein